MSYLNCNCKKCTMLLRIIKREDDIEVFNESTLKHYEVELTIMNEDKHSSIVINKNDLMELIK